MSYQKKISKKTLEIENLYASSLVHSLALLSLIFVNKTHWSNSITYNQIWHCFSFNIYCKYDSTYFSRNVYDDKPKTHVSIKNINFFFLGCKIKLTIVQMLSIRFRHCQINCLFWIWRYKQKRSKVIQFKGPKQKIIKYLIIFGF